MLSDPTPNQSVEISISHSSRFPRQNPQRSLPRMRDWSWATPHRLLRIPFARLQRCKLLPIGAAAVAIESKKVRAHEQTTHSPSEVINDDRTNRTTRNDSRRELALRMLLFLGKPFFRASPRPLYGFRSTILRLFGAEISPHVRIYSTTQICMRWNLSVGARSVVVRNVAAGNVVTGNPCQVIGRRPQPGAEINGT